MDSIFHVLCMMPLLFSSDNPVEKAESETITMLCHAFTGKDEKNILSVSVFIRKLVSRYKGLEVCHLLQKVRLHGLWQVDAAYPVVCVAILEIFIPARILENGWILWLSV